MTQPMLTKQVPGQLHCEMLFTAIGISENLKSKERIMDEETITITKSEYDRLVKDSEWLDCLEAAGVDNWQGFDDARDILHKEDA